MRTVPASEFLARAEDPQRDAHRRRVHAVWLRIRGPVFALPSALCEHNSQWEVYDADMAGCRLCGHQHACGVGTCRAEANEEGHLVCPLTGLCLRTLSFSDAEYVDTVGAASSSSARPPPRPLEHPDGQAGAPQDQEGSRLEEAVLAHVRYFLCSPERDRSVALEREKHDQRWRAGLLKELRAFKQANPGAMPVVPLAVEAVANEAGAGRDVVSLSGRDRDEVPAWCANSIVRVIRLVNRVRPGVVPECKLRGVTVGLLYMMREGVSVHGVVVLPKRPVLRSVLPLEGHLQSVMGVRSRFWCRPNVKPPPDSTPRAKKGRCITETENIVKSVMRGMDRDSLVRLGVAGVDCRMQA